MPIVQVEAQLTPDKLVEAAGQLSLSELEELEVRLRALAARRKAPCLSQEETRLLLVINQNLPEAAQARFSELMENRYSDTLTPDEYQELVALSDEREKHWADRLAAAAELARLRGVSLSNLLDQLGIRTAQGDRLIV